ncbi:MAG: RHS repeat domain-containing protein, partial [Rhodothermia bacterium]
PAGATVYYLDKLMEIETAGSSTDYRHYISDVAILTKTGDLNDPSPGIDYLHRDRLGSIVNITDVTGIIEEGRGFDAFGKPRNGDWSDKNPPTLNSAITDRGFTEHEHLDDHQLIHMNGRGFDYRLGRFLSVDPIVQAPGNSQSWNPYSYIMNNPLSGTDPSGYAAEKVTGSNIMRDPEKTPNSGGQITIGGSKLVTSFGFGPKPKKQTGNGADNNQTTGSNPNGADAGISEINSQKQTTSQEGSGDKGGDSQMDQGSSPGNTTCLGGAVDACHRSPAPVPPVVQATNRFVERLKNAVITGQALTNAELDAWGQAYMEAAALGPEAVGGFLRENPPYGATKAVLEFLASGGIVAFGRRIIPAEGIYDFASASGKTYVGQSGEIISRLRAHVRSGKLPPGNPSSITELLGGKTAREIGEQLRIDQLGGVRNLENVVNPIGEARRHLLPSQ